MRGPRRCGASGPLLFAVSMFRVLLVAPLVFRRRFGPTGVSGAGGPGCGAGLLCVPVGGGPPASRPRRELRSARRLEARPGPTTAHGHRSQAHRSLRALHAGGGGGFAALEAGWLCISGVSQL